MGEDDGRAARDDRARAGRPRCSRRCTHRLGEDARFPGAAAGAAVAQQVGSARSSGWARHLSDTRACSADLRCPAHSRAQARALRRPRHRRQRPAGGGAAHRSHEYPHRDAWPSLAPHRPDGRLRAEQPADPGARRGGPTARLGLQADHPRHRPRAAEEAADPPILRHTDAARVGSPLPLPAGTTVHLGSRRLRLGHSSAPRTALHADPARGEAGRAVGLRPHASAGQDTRLLLVVQAGGLCPCRLLRPPPRRAGALPARPAKADEAPRGLHRVLREEARGAVRHGRCRAWAGLPDGAVGCAGRRARGRPHLHPPHRPHRPPYFARPRAAAPQRVGARLPRHACQRTHHAATAPAEQAEAARLGAQAARAPLPALGHKVHGAARCRVVCPVGSAPSQQRGLRCSRAAAPGLRGELRPGCRPSCAQLVGDRGQGQGQELGGRRWRVE
mmetsp:Transcript_26515/g.85683  ORF Transcript_26515/g.85683 Transcript_26515/m.85683 type:complete len:446 (+) Transcript_26515:209-1546(+)